MPTLILISGLPCTGKTTIAEKIASCMSYPLISKDEIKELLFNDLGYESRLWSKKLSRASYAIMFCVAGAILSAGNSVVLEANYSKDKVEDEIQKIRLKCDFSIVDIFCYTRGDVLLKRFEERARSGNRHPGHFDQLVIDEMVEKLKLGENGYLGLSCKSLKVDTTDFKQIDFNSILSVIEQYISNPGDDNE